MGSRFFRVFFVCFLVCMLVCSPALAASTTESQIMMMSDDDSDGDAGIAPYVLGDSDSLNMSGYFMLWDDQLQRSVYTSETRVLTGIPTDLNYFTPGKYINIDVSETPLDSFDFDRFVFVLDFYYPDNRLFATVPFNIMFGHLFFAMWQSGPGDSLFSIDDFDSVTYSILRGTSYSDAFYTTPQKLNNALSGSSFHFYNGDVNFSGLIPFDYTVVGTGSSIYRDYGFRLYFYFNKGSVDLTRNTVKFGFGGNTDGRVGNFFSYNAGSSPSTSQQNQATQDAIKETTNAVNQVNQSIQQTISAVQQVSADLAALSSAVQQYTQQVLSGLEQQTNAISSLVTAQIQQIRQDLGLVNDNLSSGFSSVTNSITNQTQQVTQKIDTLQQNVVNKLDTVNQSITDLSDVTQKGFDDVKKGITDLPGKIGEMLKSLIVPDSEQLADKYSDFTDLAEEKLGVIYQVPEMVFEMGHTVVDGVTNQETQMQLPAFKLVMPDAEYTLWEEQKFDIWPAGTEAIQNAVQLATSMLCVILTFNSLKRKYEEWLDGR